MQRITDVIGNIHTDEKLAQSFRQWGTAGQVERVRLDMWTAQKSRLRAITDQDTTLGITLARDQALADGDVLLLDDTARRMILVEVEGRQVMVCDINNQEDATSTIELALELGHALGNQHWPIKAHGQRVYVPVIADISIMEAMMRARNLPGVQWHFTEATPEMGLPATAPSHEHVETEQGHEHTHDHGHAHHHHGAAGTA
ncbi:hypothetical protein [Halomonas sp. PR-M31]|uniref:hypothetical protein n=1 Tax=Halomonas sp. PR-M31 TaxID=1471202 RepID=UPI00069E1D9B|nr:hypothetical protein [Halomonas sp. PR-M31]